MTLLQMNVSASLIIAVIVIIRSVALDKLPKRLFQLFWFVAAARLLIPFSFHSSFSIYNLFRETPKAAAPNALAPAGAVPAATVNPALPDLASAGPVAQAPSPLTVVWVIGILLIAAWLAVLNIRGMRRFGASLPLSHPYTAKWLDQNRIRRTVTVRVSDQITTPLAYGILKPVILLPKTLDLSDTESLRYILTHELLHIKRFDLIKKLVLCAVLCVHWFNPMVWVMYSLANRDIELCCDEGVLRALGTGQNAGYALTLIAMQEK